MQKNPVYACVTSEVIAYLRGRIDKARSAGIACERIIIDPGIGFGKTIGHNLALLRNLAEFKILGMPILVGTSRKGFIGKINNADMAGRVAGTVASCVLAVAHGAHIVRVHDVKPVKQALDVTRAILHD
jgi:dihydropteroate synthase